MDHFISALLSKNTLTIPKEDDWFVPLLGDWDLRIYREPGGVPVHGEWFFRRVLNGTGIEDVFICPTDSHSDEYGASIRMYHMGQKNYIVTYASTKETLQLCFVKDGRHLVGTLLENPTEKWVFSEIRQDTFRFQKVTALDGGAWRVNCDIFANRKQN